MRAIIIEDKDAKALLTKLELTKFLEAERRPASASDTASTRLVHGGDRVTIAEMHGWFNYQVVEWLHEQGASVA